MLETCCLFEILHSLPIVTTKKKCGEKWIFLKVSAMEKPNLFLEMKEGCKISCVKIIIYCSRGKVKHQLRVTSSNPRFRRLKARVARLKAQVRRLKARV